MLWLACFRPSDIIKGGGGGFDSTSQIRCDIETARSQFEEGLALLRHAFPDTDFDIGEKGLPVPFPKRVPGVSAFREFLATPDAVAAELDFNEPCIYHAEFPDYLLQALLGFWQPEIKIYQPAPDRGEAWRRPNPGVMTWDGAIRAITMGMDSVTYHPPSLSIQRSPFLFTEDEYLNHPQFFA